MRRAPNDGFRRAWAIVVAQGALIACALVSLQLLR